MKYRPPVIVWDAFGFNAGHGGINSYAASMADALSKQDVLPHAICTQDAPIEFLPSKQRIVLPEFPYRLLKRVKLLWPRLAFHHVKKFLGKQKAIYHGLSNVNLPHISNSVRRSNQIKTVLTVHDLIPLLAGSSVSCSYREQFRVMLRSALYGAEAIICVSDWTRETLLERAPHLEGRVIVIPNARPTSCDFLSEFENPIPAKQTEDEIHLSYVARFDVYKQIHLFGDIVERVKQIRPVKATLVTDARGMMFARHAFEELIKEQILEVRIDLSPGDLLQLYRRSSVYVHTSLFEGFGLPALEALSVGTPVVFQTGSALSKILPTDSCLELGMESSVDDWVEGIFEAQRRRSQEGFGDRVFDFMQTQPTWEDNARKLIEVYSNLSA